MIERGQQCLALPANCQVFRNPRKIRPRQSAESKRLQFFSRGTVHNRHRDVLLAEGLCTIPLIVTSMRYKAGMRLADLFVRHFGRFVES
jgi:hypothetical protein